MRSQLFVRALLIVWATTMTVVGSCLMVSHWVPLPTAEFNNNELSAHLRANLGSITEGRWTAIHFLYAECPCSRRVLEHVLKQAPREDVAEQIVLIGGDAELAARASRQGYHVNQIIPEQLKTKYGVEAAPLLVVTDPQTRIRYAGGYTSRKQVLDIQYNHIVSDLLAGNEVEPLPLYGCAVSQSLRSIVDPLGLKTKSNKSSNR